MYNKKILWSGLVATMGMLAATPTVAKPIHDSGGIAIPSVATPPVTNTNVSTTQFDPGTRTISGGIVNTPVEIGSIVGSGSGSGSGSGLGSSSGSGSGLGTPTIGDSGTANGGANGDGVIASDNNNNEGGDRNASLGEGECATFACLSAKDNPQELSISDAAKLLEENIDTLAAAEEEIRIASNTRRNVLDETRHIVREKNSCPVPDRLSAEDDKAIEAREVLERQIAQSQKFIEQVNSLDDHDINIW